MIQTTPTTEKAESSQNAPTTLTAGSYRVVGANDVGRRIAPQIAAAVIGMTPENAAKTAFRMCREAAIWAESVSIEAQFPAREFTQAKPETKNMTPQQKSAQTRARNKQCAFERAEEKAKAEIILRGYGPRFYGGKCHAIEGLEPGETYYQEQFPGGYDSWQETLEAIA